MILCILEAVSFLLLIKPKTALKIIESGINKELNVTLSLGNTILQTLLWILIVYVMIRYIQDMLYIERQYTYMDKLEYEISTRIGCQNLFSREGENYNKNYPMVLNFIDLFYKMLMPILFLIINTVRIYKECIIVKTLTPSLACDIILFLSIFIISWFYFFEIHSKITEKFKKCIPLVDKISIMLRKLLKEV